MTHRFVMAAFASAILASPVAAQVVETPVSFDPVQTTTGAVAGKVLDSGVNAWLGVPFAAPPLRELRWQPPQAPAAWKGVYNADRFAPECMQPLRNSDINHYFGEEAISEDCLYLNVWAPEGVTPDSNLPVVVWIYGGGFNVGSASMDNYQGENLAKEGVVYVSIAYRLGAMGFMAHPDLAAENDYAGSGNYGLMDQAFALHWVRDNIAGFGGDPENVTITGQSAGSMSLNAMQTSPLSEGAFDKIFAMSGSLMTRFGSPYVEMEQQGLDAQEQLGAASLADLRAVSADKFLDLDGLRFGVTWDGYALPKPPAEAFAEGDFMDVPLVVGYTRDEAFHPIGRAQTTEEFMSAAEEAWPGKSEELATAYDPEGRGAHRAAVDVARDAAMGAAGVDWALAQRDFGTAPVWVYRFDRTQPYADGISFPDHDPATVGAYHSVEMPYFLRNLDSLNKFRTTRDWGPEDEALRDVASGSLLALAKTGNPSNESFDWPQFDAEEMQVVTFDIGPIKAGEIPERAGVELLRSYRTNP